MVLLHIVYPLFIFLFFLLFEEFVGVSVFIVTHFVVIRKGRQRGNGKKKKRRRKRRGGCASTRRKKGKRRGERGCRLTRDEHCSRRRTDVATGERCFGAQGHEKVKDKIR